LPGRDPVMVLGALATLTRWRGRFCWRRSARELGGQSAGVVLWLVRAGDPLVSHRRGELTGFAAASHLARSGTSE
jgi:hypothetical protein